jgi:Flp pilus assembly pilin Flp
MASELSSEHSIAVPAVPSRRDRLRSGQSLVEYALILVLVAIAAGVTLAATGPAIGNIFSNVLFNVIGANPEDISDLEAGNAVNFWLTVEWVATNPQQETPFPTPLSLPNTLVPTNFVTPTPSNTSTPSHTFTPTFTATNTFTPTHTASFTPGPTSTPDDIQFRVPHADLSDNIDWWRLDNTFGVGGGQWDATYYATNNFTGTAYTNADYLATSNGLLDYNWANSNPRDSLPFVPTFPSGSNEFSAIYLKAFDVRGNTDVTFDYTIGQADSIEFRVDGVSIHSYTNPSSGAEGGNIFTYTFLDGARTLEIRYRDPNGGGSANLARLNVRVQRQLSNPDNSTSGCAWLNIGPATQYSSSSPRVWSEGPTTGPTAWTAGRTCILELRGYLDLSTASNPKLSWWDVWDFTANSGVNARIEFASYITDGDGFFDRDNATWQSFNVRSGGTANYNWTRNQIDLNSLGLGNSVTVRFVLTSSSSGNVRWNIDDLQVVADPVVLPDDATYTVGDVWDFNSRGQMADFFFNADANYTRELAGLTTEGFRWNITSTNARSGSSMDGSPGGSFPNSLGSGGASNQQRVHFIEFRRQIDVTGSRSPAVSAADYEGDTGVPVLSFWHAYDVGTGGQLSVEYTRDALNDTSGTPDNWTIVPTDGLLLNSTGAAPGTNRNDGGPTRTSLTMREIQVRLDQIPNWNTQPFRLRFAIRYNAGTAANDWYIDDVRIEREDSAQYAAYPLADSAESATDSSKLWTQNGPTGVWTATNTRGGYAGTANSYADTPSSDYTVGTTTALEMQRTIDLLNDTPDNDPPDGESPARPAAINPIMSFMFQTDSENVNLFVDVWTARTNSWTEAWRYQVTGRRIQKTWERVEISLTAALQAHLRAQTGDNTWQWGGSGATSITANSCSLATLENCVDDDVRVRIRFETAGGTARDGFYVDDIRVENSGTYVHRLWDAVPFGGLVTGPGDGQFVDTIETRSPALAFNDTFAKRWFTGGTWSTTSASARSGLLSASDSPLVGQQYSDNGLSILEMRAIVDLRGSDPSLLPSLSFFTRYAIGSGDQLRVQVAQENTSDFTQAYNDLAGWNAWTDQTVTGATVPWSASPGPDEVRTWFRARVNLSSFAGTRIRIRFLLSSDATTQADGLWLDDIRVSQGVSTRNTGSAPFRFDEYFAGGANWILEGNWGTTLQYIAPNSPAAVSLGGPWDGFYIDCETYGAGTCSNYATNETMLNDNAATGLALDAATFPLPDGMFPADLTFEINNWWGTARPHPSADSRFDNSWAARWVRNVTLAGGASYRVYTIADDGVRLTINDRTGTDIPAAGAIAPAGRIINNWSAHSTQIDYTTFTVTGGTISRTLTLDYVENSGDAVMVLSMTSGTFSMTDTPNVVSGTSGSGETTGGFGYTQVASSNYGWSSLVLNGVIDMTGASSPQFTYTRYYNLTANTNFRLEFSSDGGFTWNVIASEDINGAASLLPPANPWQTRTISIPGAYLNNRFTFRFRLDTRAAGAGATGDSIWIGNIVVRG